MARNEYVNIRREEERKHDNYIIDKCVKQPKLFYRYVNKKQKQRESINRQRDNRSDENQEK